MHHIDNKYMEMILYILNSHIYDEKNIQLYFSLKIDDLNHQYELILNQEDIELFHDKIVYILHY